MKQRYEVKVDGQPLVQILCHPNASEETIASMLEEAAEFFRGHVKQCPVCGDAARKSGDYLCETCGTDCSAAGVCRVIPFPGRKQRR